VPLSYDLVTGPTVEPVTVTLAKLQCRVDFTDDDALFAVYIPAARQMLEKKMGRAIFNQTWKRTLDHFPLWWSADGTVNPSYRNDWPYYSDFWNRITIDIPMPKTVSVTSITYVDTNGVMQTLQGPVVYTDLVIGATPNQLSSAANPFTAASVGNQLAITGGTGFTPATYTVESVTGGVATMNAVVGTADSTGGQGSFGGDYVVDLTSEPARIVPAEGTYWPSEMTYIPGSVVITFVAGSYGDGTDVNNCPMTIVQAIPLLVDHWYNNRGAVGTATKQIELGVESLIETEVVTYTNYRPC
jgi:hypothetical protein